LGDSLTQGFQSGAIYRTDLSYPALIARTLGFKEFRYPNFSAQAGMPINVEILLRGIEDEFGEEITWDETVGVTQHTLQTLLRIKHYWEGKKGSLADENQTLPFHNQSMFSATIMDALLLNDATCKAYIDVSKEHESFTNLLAHNAFYTGFRRVINPSFHPNGYKNTAFSNVKWFSDNGGIENLIVYLGSNNIVGALTDLNIEIAQESDLEKPPFDRKATVYPPRVFRKAYERLAEHLAGLNTKHVYTATVPIVTQAPLIKSITRNNQNYYTHVWVMDEDFDPALHPHLTQQDIDLLNTYCIEYNRIILEIAEKFKWNVLRVDEMVTQLNPTLRTIPPASLYPHGLVRALKRNPQTKHLAEGEFNTRLNTSYPKIDSLTGKLIDGGIFTLDGIHPTTIAYGLVAAGFIRLMQKNGVKFEASLDWDFIVREDSLTSNPPRLLNDLKRVMGYFSSDYKSMFSKLGSNVFNEMVAIFGGRN
jgi:hypothetical protein